MREQPRQSAGMIAVRYGIGAVIVLAGIVFIVVNPPTGKRRRGT